MISTVTAVAERFALTAREREVLRLLATGVTYAPTIASLLGLRPNTIHNHFKSIFRRTSTRGKAELLALVLEIALEQQARVAPFVRPPRILLALQRPDPLASVLNRIGMQVRSISVDEARTREATHDVDVLIIEGNGEADDVHGARGPLVLHVYDGPVAPQSRAGGLLSLGDDVHRIVLSIMLHVTSDEYQRSRLLRVDVNLQARLNGGAHTALSNLGTGGAFVQLSGEQMQELDTALPLDLDVTLDDARTLSLRASVVWQRREGRHGMPTGIGVRFTDPALDARLQLEDFVSTRRFAAWLSPPPPLPRIGGRSYGYQQTV
ncbi:MAG TPA: PilZ domain-containing protein [Polyangiales bacterium]|nr:PilZ domain-containing protein [Polyangiales bacterium]